jgi:hypothetical protein
MSLTLSDVMRMPQRCRAVTPYNALTPIVHWHSWMMCTLD